MRYLYLVIILITATSQDNTGDHTNLFAAGRRRRQSWHPDRLRTSPDRPSDQSKRAPNLSKHTHTHTKRSSESRKRKRRSKRSSQTHQALCAADENAPAISSTPHRPPASSPQSGQNWMSWSSERGPSDRKGAPGASRLTQPGQAKHQNQAAA